jgi:hypothetical protein
MKPLIAIRRSLIWRRLADEQGAIAVLVGLFIFLVVLGLGAVTVDLGSWFTHKRHLQTQADAAALAGGSAWAFPCTTTINTAIVDAARQYAGPSQTGNTGPYNPQIGGTPASNVHILLNSPSYFGQTGAADLSEGQPCSLGYLDVKATESNPVRFFDTTGLVGSLSTRARVKAVEIVADNGFNPVGVEVPRIYKAQATITRCVGGTPLTAQTEILLKPLPAGQQTVPGMVLWGPDPAVYPTGSVAVTNPPGAECSGYDSEGINVNVQVSGNNNVTPSAANCAARFIGCYDTVWLRAWNAPSGGASANPEFGNVTLVGSTCAPGSPYWSSGNVTTLPCTFSAQVDVNWGDRLGTGFTATLTADAGGGGGTVNASGGNGTYTIPGLSSGDGVAANGLNSPQNVGVSWTWERTSGTWRGNNCKTGNGNKCKGSGGPVNVHRANAANSSPVLTVAVTNPQNGASLESFDKSGFPAAMKLVVGMTNGADPNAGFQLRQRVVLRTTSSQGSGALNCDNLPPGQVLSEYVSGCKSWFGTNDLTPGAWEPCPSPPSFPANSSTAPWLCSPQEPGGQGSKVVPDGLDVASGNCSALNGGGNQCKTPACNYKNQYDPNNPNQVFDPTTDKRVMKIFLVPYGSLKDVGGNGQAGAVEVVGSADFYASGWTGDPCYGQSPNSETVPPNGDAVGHFVKIVELDNPIPDPNKNCDADLLTPCTVVLVR